ncbi:putative lipid II flippase FtsW [Alteromonas gracilis]
MTQTVSRPPSRESRSGLRAWLESVRELMDRPLTPYYLLVGATSLLLAIGLMAVLSASSVSAYRDYGSSYYWFGRQVTWVAIGIPCAIVAARLPHRLLRALAWPAIVFSLVLIGLTRTSLGVTVNGNTNWLDLGPVQVQPAEVAKLALILWAADVFARKDRLLRNPVHVLVPVVPVFLVATVFVAVLGRDLGTGLVLLSILLGMLWVVGAPGRLFAMALTLLGVGVLVLATTDSERMSRLTSFTDPFKDFEDSGWQSAHGLLGMASGGVFGKGIGASQQKWGSLPEPHTDFIFAVLGEELGLIGTLLVLALFLAITWSGLRVATRAEDPFVRYLAAGITIWLTVQTVINIGMVLALFPVVGLPLPFVSYGGSSLVPELVAIGLLIAFARRDPAAARALRDRKRERVRAVKVS